MDNFTYYNPTKLVFGKGQIAQLKDLVPANARILLTYGGGSIMRNGVYEQVKTALSGFTVLEFGGIEPNPRYETCMKAVEVVTREKVDFLLAVGGGSVLDGTKFIAVAPFADGDPWQFCANRANVKPQKALPIGCVLTLPATGSESNTNAVISRESTKEKLAFSSPLVYPQFSILDPETTYSLPPRQTANGIVDTFVHTTEQYLTRHNDAPLQDRYAEGILSTVIEEAPKVMADPCSYSARSNLMWCATQALNHLIGCGQITDWASHMIGHELTALFGVDHGQSLAVVMPAVLRYRLEDKREKLVQYAERVWKITEGDADAKALAAIDRTKEFFGSLGVGTTLQDYDIKLEDCREAAERREARGLVGENKDTGAEDIMAILALANAPAASVR